MTKKKKKRKPAADDEHVLPAPAMPASELGNYSVNPDPDVERDIAQYVESQTRGDEVVQHVERIKSEHVLGTRYEIWDVTTDKDRYWVIDPMKNLYPHSYFPSMDYTLSFHIGLVSRMRARSPLPDSFDPDPFDDVFRRQSQVHERHDTAVEAEEAPTDDTDERDQRLQSHDGYVVIFDDLKRFARDTIFHLKLRQELAAYGATVECLNFKFEDTPEGQFVETVIAAQGQLERLQNRRQTLQKMKARLERGYYVFAAPVGYRYEKLEGHGRMLVRDEPLASIKKPSKATPRVDSSYRRK